MAQYRWTTLPLGFTCRTARIALVATGALATLACREPTQIKLDLYTDVAFYQGRSIAIELRSDNASSDEPVAIVEDEWPEDGYLGSLVVVPKERNKRGRIDAEVVMGINRDPRECSLDESANCIFARRQLSFVKHRSLKLPIVLHAICNGVICEEDETCNALGECVAAHVDGCANGNCMVEGDDVPSSGTTGCLEGVTRPIGNWDVVPDQTIDGEFAVGVVAFHEEGANVTLSVDGTEIAHIEEPSYNERTGVNEYWTVIDPGQYPDGPITLSAIIHSDGEGYQPRKLPDITLYANAGGSLEYSEKWVDCNSGSDSAEGTEEDPYQSLGRALDEIGDGGTILLQPGQCYQLPDWNEGLVPHSRWVTVTPAPGFERSDVSIITASADFDHAWLPHDHVRFKDVVIYSDSSDDSDIVLGVPMENLCWLDNVELYEANPEMERGAFGFPERVYLTDTHLSNLSDATHHFGRNVTVEDVSYFVMVHSNLTYINSAARDVDSHFIKHHSAPAELVENVVVYNAQGYDLDAEGIVGFAGRLRGIALVNVLVEQEPADADHESCLEANWDHALMWHLSLVDSDFSVCYPHWQCNIHIRNSSLAAFHFGGGSQRGIHMDHNWFARLEDGQDEPVGEHAGVGDPLYADPSENAFSPGDDSPLCSGGAPLPKLNTDIEGKPYDPEAPALGAYACP